MGNQFNTKMERRRINSEGKNCSGHSECYLNKYEVGPIFFYEFRIKRQNVCDVVSSLAECSHGSANVCTRNVAMGKLCRSNTGILQCLVFQTILLTKFRNSTFDKYI